MNIAGVTDMSQNLTNRHKGFQCGIQLWDDGTFVKITQCQTSKTPLTDEVNIIEYFIIMLVVGRCPISGEHYAVEANVVEAE